VLALLQLLLADVAAKKRVAVLVDAVGEVLTGHADGSATPPLQFPFVNEWPILHTLLAGSYVLLREAIWRQVLLCE
jgi:hypothetical protein